jgi:hypothetical protein
VLIGQAGITAEASIGPVIMDRTTGLTNMEVRNDDGGAIIYRGALSCSEPAADPGGPTRGLVMNCNGKPELVRCDSGHKTMCCGADLPQ